MNQRDYDLRLFCGGLLPREMVWAYMSRLVGQFFKILPLFENGEPSRNEYMLSLKAELAGCTNLMYALHDDADFLTLLAILQYLLDHSDALLDNQQTVKREVFKAISLCDGLRARFGTESATEVKADGD